MILLSLLGKTILSLPAKDGAGATELIEIYDLKAYNQLEKAIKNINRDIEKFFENYD